VFRPTFSPTESQRAIGRNLALDLVGAIGLGVTMALITALLPTIARRGGLEPLGLSALAAAPFVANFLGAFAGRFGPRSSRELAGIRAAGAGALVLLVVAPLPAVMVIVSVLFWLSVSFAGPFQLRLWGSMYPSRLRGRVVGAIGMGRAAAGAVAAFFGGLIADRLGGPPAVALAGVVGLLCALAYVGLHAPTAERPRGFSARESIRALQERPILARMALAQGFYGGGLIAAAPLFALFFLARRGVEAWLNSLAGDFHVAHCGRRHSFQEFAADLVDGFPNCFPLLGGEARVFQEGAPFEIVGHLDLRDIIQAFDALADGFLPLTQRVLPLSEGGGNVVESADVFPLEQIGQRSGRLHTLPPSVLFGQIDAWQGNEEGGPAGQVHEGAIAPFLHEP